jgi:pyruvate/2-oxoglutarate/acetoin dehydrogenase E1 component
LKHAKTLVLEKAVLGSRHCSSIVGAGVGMALRGLRTIAEIQYLDYIPYAIQQLIDELAPLRHRTDGGQSAPLLVRTHGGQLVGMWHSGFPLGMILSSCPGLRVLVPRDGARAVAMYKAVMESEDPAFSVEPLQILYTKEKVPNNLAEISTPLGHSEVLKQGDALTIITYGTCCSTALEAASQLEEMGINVELVDLQTLCPIDENGVALASIKKTGKVLFLDEDIPNGASAFVLNTLINERGGLLHAEAIATLTAPAHKPPYGEDGKFFGKPQPGDIVKKVCDMLDELDSGSRSTY